MDACHPSPCGKGALCESSYQGAICKCPKGTTGNPFERCGNYLISNVVAVIEMHSALHNFFVSCYIQLQTTVNANELHVVL